MKRALRIMPYLPSQSKESKTLQQNPPQLPQPPHKRQPSQGTPHGRTQKLSPECETMELCGTCQTSAIIFPPYQTGAALGTPSDQLHEFVSRPALSTPSQQQSSGNFPELLPWGHQPHLSFSSTFSYLPSQLQHLNQHWDLQNPVDLQDLWDLQNLWLLWFFCLSFWHRHCFCWPIVLCFQEVCDP